MAKQSKWVALDPTLHHPGCRKEEEGSMIEQEAVESIRTTQVAEEHLFIKDSFDVTVTTTDTQAAVNLQVAIQLAIALVLSITIGDGHAAESISQELVQRIRTRQATHQRTIIENSRGVSVTTTDTEIAVNIQVLLQVLLALVAKLEIL